MFKQRCPLCGLKLGDFLYADLCPHCHQPLEQNRAEIAAPKELDRPKSWASRAFFGLVRFVER